MPGLPTAGNPIFAQNASALIEFVKRAFGAEEGFRAVGSAGGIHAEVRIGDTMLMMGGGGPGLSWRGESIPMAFHMYVPDCDATYQRALEAGGTSIAEPVDQFYGERSGGVKDPARSEEHTSELQSPCNLVCRLLLEKKKKKYSHVNSSQIPTIPYTMANPILYQSSLTNTVISLTNPLCRQFTVFECATYVSARARTS